MSYKKLLTVLPCAALWAAMPPKAGAEPPQPPPQQQQQQGMVVVRDPQSGQLRAATPAEIRALAPASASASARLSAPSQPAMVTHPGGSRHVRLGERGLVYSVVTRGADGMLAQECVHGNAAAEKAVHAATGTGSSASSSAAAAHQEGHHHD